MMTDFSVLITCAQCGQRFRLGAVAETVHVTCPKCQAQWDWNAAASSRKTVGTFWRALVLRPRLSFGASALLLAAGVGLGFWMGSSTPEPVLEDFSQGLAPANDPPLVKSAASPAAPGQRGPTVGLAPAETFLPFNGVDFNLPAPLGTNL